MGRMFIFCEWGFFFLFNQGYIFWPFPRPGGGGKFLSKVKNREEFEGGIEKRKEKGGKRRKKEKSDETHVKIPL